MTNIVRIVAQYAFEARQVILRGILIKIQYRDLGLRTYPQNVARLDLPFEIERRADAFDCPREMLGVRPAHQVRGDEPVRDLIVVDVLVNSAVGRTAEG